MKSILFSAVAAATFGLSAATHNWKASVTDGDFDSPDSWTEGSAPGAESTTLVQGLSSDTDYKIHFPAAGYEPCIKDFTCLIGSSGTRSVSLDGSFLMPTTNSWKYGGIPFSFRTVTSGGMIYGFEDYTYGGMFGFENLDLRVSRDSANNIRILQCGGVMNAMTNKATASCKLSMGVPSANSYEYVYTGGGTRFNYGGALTLACNAPRTLLAITNGAAARVYALQIPTAASSAPTNTVRVTGAGSQLDVTGELTLGNTGIAEDRVMEFDVWDGATMSVQIAKHEGKGTAFYDIRNSTFSFNGNPSGANQFGRAAGAHTIFRMVGSTMNFNNYQSFGQKGGGTVDFRVETSRILSNYQDYYNHGTFVFDRCAYTNSTYGVYVAQISAALADSASMKFLSSHVNLKTDLKVGDNGASGTLEAVDTDIALGGALYLADHNGSNGTLKLSGGSLACCMCLLCYEGTSGTSSLQLADGATMTTTGTTSFGVRGTCEATVGSGTVFNSNGTAANQTSIGLYASGNGTVTVRGTLDVATNLSVGDAGTGTLTVEEGALCRAKTVDVGRSSGGTGTVNLNGGTIRAALNGGSGTSTLAANGGTNVAVSSAATLSNFTTATIGAKGLVLDTAGYDVTVGSSFAGAGTLVKTGAGTMTVTAGSAHAKTVVEAGGIAFSGVSSYPAVELARDARLTVDLSQSLTLAGLVLTNRANVVFTGGTGTDGTYGVFTVSGSVDAATKAAWSRAAPISGGTDGKGYLFTSETAEGVTTFRVQVATRSDPSGTATWTGPGGNWSDGANWGGAKPGATETAVFAGAEPTDVNVSGTETVGALAFTSDRGYAVTNGTIQLSPLVNAAVSVSAGTQTVESTVIVPSATSVSVASGKRLDLKGPLLDGSLVKTGGGALVLAGENDLPGGASAEEGLLAIERPDAFGGDVTLKAGTLALGKAGAAAAAFAGTLTLDAAAADTHVGIRTDSDVTMAVPTVKNGLVVKTGAGRLAFRTGTYTQFAKNYGAMGTSGYPKTTVDYGANAYVADANDFAPDTEKFGGFTVLEGEARFAATARSVGYYVEPAVTVGLNTPAGDPCGANPQLTVADCTFTSFASSHNSMFLGAGVTASAAMTGATLSLSNTDLTVSSLYAGGRSGANSTKPNLALTVAATNAKMTVMWALYYAGSAGAGATYRYFFRNSSLCTGAGGLDAMDSGTCGTATFDFDNSILTDKDTLGPIRYWRSTWTASTVDAAFRNGGILRCERIFLSNGNVLRFDGGYWEPSQTADAMLITRGDNGTTAVRAEGAGLRLAPVADRTWTLYQPIAGDGAIVKEGAGTLAVAAAAGAKVLDANYLTWSNEPLADPRTLVNGGGLELNAGTVKFLAGGVVPESLKVRVTGAATLQDAALTNAVFAVTPGGARLALANCTFAGRTTVDCGGASAAYGDAFDLFTYTGTAPDVSRWRASNLAVGGRRTRGAFAAADGKVTLTVTPPSGLCIWLK